MLIASARWVPIRKASTSPGVLAVADRMDPTVRRRFLAAIAAISDADAETLVAAVRSRDAAAIARALSDRCRACWRRPPRRSSSASSRPD